MIRSASFWIFVLVGANAFLAYWDNYNLLFPIFLCGALFVIVRAWSQWRGWPRQRWLAAGSVIIGLFALLAVLEAGLRLTGKGATYLEKVGQGWKSPYADPEPNRKWFHLWTPNIHFPAGRSEFSYVKKTNGEGLPDTLDYSVQKPDSVYRIIALGDSFTEGVGAPQDSAWPQRLCGMLRETYPQGVEVINAGVSGSDPVYQLALLRERLAKYRPDQVVMMVNNSDVEDLITRGGKERFQPDSVVHFRKGPWFEPIYRSSYVFRALMHGLLRMDQLYLTPRARRLADERAAAELAATAREAHGFCSARGCRFTLVFQPLVNEMHGDSARLAQAIGKSLTDNGVDVLYLLDCFRDLGDMLGENTARFSWPIDQHYNSLGYERVARCIVPACSSR
jgi:hypothetical protein